MFRINDRVGMGNLFIFLSQLDETTPVSDEIYSGFRDKYLKFKNLNIVPDDGTLESLKLDIYINNYTMKNVHPLFRNKVEPSEYLLKLLEEHKHLVENVECAVAIRFSQIPHSDGTLEPTKHVDDKALEEFDEIIKNSKGCVFVACDKREYKYELRRKFGDKVSFVDDEVVISCTKNTIDAPTPYLEFFLLSMCPFVYLTGGPIDMHAFSTFGYMAAIYGGKPFHPIWNTT